MEPNKKPKCRKKIISEALALRKMREIRGLSRKEASTLLGIGHKAIEKIENGKPNLKRPRIAQIVEAYGLTHTDFLLCCEGKSEQIREKFCHKKARPLSQKEQALIYKNGRRFHKKVITKEIRVLKFLRTLKDLSQYKASFICGYHKNAIGHIENGRVELSRTKIAHIVESDGFTMTDFECHMESKILLTEVQDECVSIIKSLCEERLKVVHPVLLTFK